MTPTVSRLSAKSSKGLFVGITLYLMCYALYLKDVISQEFADIISINSGFSSTYYLIGMCVITLLISVSYKKYFIHTNYTRCYFLMCASIALMSFLHMFSVEVGAREVYIGIICWFTCFFSFYYLALTNRIKRIRVYLYLFFAFLVFEYLATYLNMGSFSTTLFTMNSSYLLLALFPFLMLISDRRIQIVTTIVIVLCLLFSNKRGGTVAASLGIVVYYIVEYVFLQKGEKKNSNKFISIFSFGVIILVLWYLVQYALTLDSVVLIERFVSMDDDDGSGRLLIWTEVINRFSSSDLFEIIMGHGYDSVKRYTFENLSAHNDYLEVLFDFGIIGFVAYATFIISMFRYAIKLVKLNSPIASSFWASIVFFSVLSVMSHILIYPAYMILYCMYWGYAMGLDRNPRLKEY